MLDLSRIHHVAIIVSDYEKSKEFYVNKLGFAVIRENYRPERGDWKLDLKLGEAELEIFGIPGRPARPTNPEANGLRHLALKTEDAEVAREKLITAGYAPEPIHTDTFNGRKLFYVKDPDGLPIELHE